MLESSTSSFYASSTSQATEDAPYRRIDIIFNLGHRQSPSPIRRPQPVPEPNETADELAVSSTPFPLLCFARSHAVAPPPTFPSTAVRHGRVALLTRAPLLEPVAPACFWWPADAVWTISFSPSAPQPNPAHGRAPAAASGSTPVNPGHPRYLLVPLARRSDAPSASPASPAVLCGRRRLHSGES